MVDFSRFERSVPIGIKSGFNFCPACRAICPGKFGCRFNQRVQPVCSGRRLFRPNRIRRAGNALSGREFCILGARRISRAFDIDFQITLAAVKGITDPVKLKRFDTDGYAFDKKASNDTTWVFRRKAA